MADDQMNHQSSSALGAEDQAAPEAQPEAPAVDCGTAAAQKPIPRENPPPDAAMPPARSLLDQQKTVISKRPPVSEPALKRAATPFEIGATLQGKRLGHFQLEEFVGGGGMGAVFRAADTMLGRTVAVKVLSRDQTDEETLRRFKNEAQSAARFDHENIARVYYVGEDEGWNYIVFEFVEGVNIRDLVCQKGPLPLEEAVSYTLQVAEALDHAFRRDVIHRDIKPSNVLVTAGGQAKLVDLGLARLHQVESSSNDLTASGVTLGTFDYISPEQARDPRSTDVRSDLYSLGCTFYYMLTGQAPFPEGTVLQKLLSHTGEPPPDPRLYRPELSEEMAAVVSKLLAKTPADRHQEPSELIGELLLLSEQLGLPASGRLGTVWITPAGKRFSLLERHLPWAAPTLLLMTIVFAVAFLSSSSEPAQPPRPKFGPAQQPPPAAATEASAAAVEAPSAPDVQQLAESSDAPSDSAPPGEANLSDADQLAGPDNSPPSPAPPATQGEAGSPEGVASSAPGPAAGAASEAVPPSVAPDAMRPAQTDAGPPPPAPTAEVSLLMVARQPTSAPPGARAVRSLAQACRLAAESPDVRTIELCYDGDLLERPLDIAAPSLTIRAGAGYRPVVLFRPETSDLSARRRMIEIVGGQVAWQGVHFRFELPGEPSDGWSLFGLDRARRLDVRDCTMSIHNPGGWEAPLHDRVAFFELDGAPSARPMTSSAQTASAIPPLINLARCLVRGRATLIRAEQASPFRLTWEQGLFVTTERFIETGGTVVKPNWDGRMDVVLQNVTAVVPRGFCLMSIDALAPYQLELVTRCRDSIFVTDPDAPLIEQRGSTCAQDLLKRPIVGGADNFYPNTTVILRLDPTGRESDVTQYAFDQRDEARDEGWYEEKRAQSALAWRTLLPADLPVDSQTKEHYLLDNNPTNPAMSSGEFGGGAGFYPSLIPDPPPGSGPAFPRDTTEAMGPSAELPSPSRS